MNAVISTNERACHVTFKHRYNQIYQMKTTYVYEAWNFNGALADIFSFSIGRKFREIRICEIWAARVFLSCNYILRPCSHFLFT